MGRDWNDKKILDAGCGIGFFSRYFEERGAKVIGIDFSKNMINVARENAPNSDFIVGSLISLPFDNEIFDFIYTSSVLIRIVEDKEWKKALSELNRCLKKSERLFLYRNLEIFILKTTR